MPGRWILDIFGEVNAEVESLTNGQQSPAMFMQGAPPRIVLRPIPAHAQSEAKATPVVSNQLEPSARRYVSFDVGDGSAAFSRTRAFLAGNGVHEHFKDSEVGPEMVVVPAGAFRMGEDEDGASSESEGPAHLVTIARPFAIGRCCVTVSEYRSFVEATGHATVDPIFSLSGQFLALGDLVVTTKAGRTWRRPGFTQTDNHPVVGVSWRDANAYVTWLSASTRRPYRLLSEAEWEYAARAGSSHRYAWGQVITRARANFDDNPELRRRNPTAWRYQARRGTCPADYFDPNAWGLSNMHGNVAEWVEDDWHDTYVGAPADGSSWLSGQGEGNAVPIKVVRGGGWTSTASDVRSAARSNKLASSAAAWIGFRVARDIDEI
jgi:formylglycine-generating enzyme required for sulfatase activity